MSIINAIREKAYFTSATGADPTAVQEAEKALGLRFADEYREYLLTFGIASYRGHELSGICKSDRLNVVSLTRHQRELDPEVPADWYVVEQANIDGIIIWQDQTGSIYATAPGHMPSKINSTLREYICSE